VSKRVLDDISTVAAAFALDLTPDGRVRRLHAAYGGIAATPIRASAVEAAAAGRPWMRETIDALLPIAATIGTPLSDLRGTADYRRAMVGRLLEKLFAETAASPAPAEAIR
jgi:xanthine dehydrogenase small subunit